jgi:hypothetical protein
MLPVPVNRTVPPALLATLALTVSAARALLAGGAICAPIWTWLCGLVFAVLLLGTLRWLDFDAWLAGIVVCATLLYLGYSSYTDLTERNYDGLDHFLYANDIALHGELPPVTACVACSHPPLYPLLGAAAIQVARWTGLASPPCSLQALSLFFSLGFVLFGVRTLQCFTADRVAQRLGAALLAFWPTSVTQSIRVHDDVPLACFGAGVLFFLVRWQKNDRAADLGWAILLTGLAVFTKANAYAWVLLLLALVTARMARDKLARPRIRQAGLAWGVSVASIFLATQLRASKAGATACHRAIGIICNITSEHFVGNTWRNYLTFDLRFFLGQPYLLDDPRDPAHDYFLNTLLKSSLLNAVPLGPEFDDRLSAGLATILSYLLLGLLVYLLLGLLTPMLWRQPGHGVLLLACLFMLGPLIALRIKVPLSMHADFRYVFPLLVPGSVWYSKLIEHWRRRSRFLFAAGSLLVGLTVAASVLFFRQNDARAKGHPAPRFEPVECSLDRFSEIRPSSTPVKDERVLRFGPRQLLEFSLPAGTQVSRVDVSLDADDEYEITVQGGDGIRQVVVGPTAGVDGLARYERQLMAPLFDVRTVTVRPLESDGYYALGHLRAIP